MKKLVIGILATLLLFSTGISYANTPADIRAARERAKRLKKKASTEAREEAKRLLEEGWRQFPGAKSLANQLDEAYMMEFEIDAAGVPTYLRANGSGEGGTMEDAKRRAIESAKFNLASQLSSKLSGSTSLQMNSNQYGNNVTTNSNLQLTGNDQFNHTLGQVTPVLEMFREINHGYEVQVRLYYNPNYNKTEAENIRIKYYYLDEIWSHNRYTNLGYSFSNTHTSDVSEKGKFGFFLTKGTSFLYPSEPFLDHFKVGFDINWIDLSFAKYDSDLKHIIRDESGTNKNVSRWNVMIGLFGVGPNITVAPLTSLYNDASFLKVSVYFHYQPIYGMYLTSFNDRTEFSGAYCNMFQIGGRISYKNVGLGIEGFWGSGKFKQLDTDKTIYGNLYPTKDKIMRHFSNTRLYISFTF